SCRVMPRCARGRAPRTTRWQLAIGSTRPNAIADQTSCLVRRHIAVVRNWVVATAGFARNDLFRSATLERFVALLSGALTGAGYEQLDAPTADTAVVLHAVDIEEPRPYRRKAAPTFVIAIAEVPEPPDDLLRTGYPLLVRCLANLCVMV